MPSDFQPCYLGSKVPRSAGVWGVIPHLGLQLAEVYKYQLAVPFRLQKEAPVFPSSQIFQPSSQGRRGLPWTADCPSLGAFLARDGATRHSFIAWVLLLAKKRFITSS